MCIIIAHEGPTVHPVTDDVLDICLHNHPHGFGLAWIEGGHVKVTHSLDEGVIRKKYYEVCQIKGTSVILHYRRKTHGPVEIENCHPFKIKNDLYFAHNKTVHRCKPAANALHGKSDTRLFNEEILQKLPNNFHRNNVMKRLIEPFIDNSRIAVLDPKGLVYWNKQKGVTIGDTWYSNDSYKFREYKAENGYPHGNPNAYWNQPEDKGKLPVRRDLYLKQMKNPPAVLLGNEFIADNLLCRWDNLNKLTLAWDSTQRVWRDYDNISGRFLNKPYTTPEHITSKYKQFRAAWETLHDAVTDEPTYVRCACCNDDVDKESTTKECPFFEGEFVCSECLTFFHEHKEIN